MNESVDPDLKWRQSDSCADSACLQAALDGDRVLLRDSDDPDTVVRVPRQSWEAFKQGVIEGDFDQI